MPHRRQVLRLRRTASRLRDLTARRSRAEWLPCCECRVGRPEAAKRVEEVLDGKTAIREGRYVTEMMENHRGVWGSGSGTPGIRLGNTGTAFGVSGRVNRQMRRQVDGGSHAKPAATPPGRRGR